MRRLTLALCAGLSLSAATVAVADSPDAPLSVSAGAAARIVLSAPVRDIVVGDPTVADVSLVNERTLVVLGKKAGATTVLAFDARGRALADRDVVVSDVPDPGGRRPARRQGRDLCLRRSLLAAELHHRARAGAGRRHAVGVPHGHQIARPKPLIRDARPRLRRLPFL
jgi:hypothetical protein